MSNKKLPGKRERLEAEKRTAKKKRTKMNSLRRRAKKGQRA
jgi:hypothetical protein